MTDPIKVGVIGANITVQGAGSWGAIAHIPALQSLSGFEVVAVATTRAETAAATAEKLGVPKSFGDYRTMLDLAEIDMIAVCTRVPHHAELVKAALDAGKHVYCEWPLACTLAESKELTALAAAAGRKGFVGLQSRVSPSLRHMKALIDAGEIGAVRGVTFLHSAPWPSVIPADMAYLELLASGGNLLTIRGGHSLDAVLSVAGPLADSQGMTALLAPDVQLIDRGEVMQRTCPDHLVMQGRLAGGGLVAFQILGGTSPGTGILFEITGGKGSLIARSPGATAGVQAALLSLEKTDGPGTKPRPVLIPEDLFPSLPADIPDAATNVAAMYGEIAAALNGKPNLATSFDDGVTHHRLLSQLWGAP